MVDAPPAVRITETNRLDESKVLNIDHAGSKEPAGNDRLPPERFRNAQVAGSVDAQL
jgi:hypothetical protein